MFLKIARVVVTVLFVIASLIAVSAVTAPAALAGDPPCTTRPDNLTRNGSVAGGYDTAHGTVAEAWNIFTLNGDTPQYDLVDNENGFDPQVGQYSQYIHGDGIQFDAGIYQTVSGTQPGAYYDFKIGFAPMLRDIGAGQNRKMDDVVGRRVGVDPTGGTDPHSPTVIWGPEWWGGGYGASINNPDMSLTFAAQAPQVTVYARVFNRGTSASDKVWFDVMCVLPRGDLPTVTPNATATPAPTDAPVAQPAAPAQPQPTRAPPTRVPTKTPLPPTRTFTPRPTETNTPKPTRAPTDTPAPRAIIPQVSLASNDGVGGASASDPSSAGASAAGNSLSLAVVLGSIGIIGISALGIVLVGAFVVWRLFVRQVDQALDPAYLPDEHV